MPQLDPSTFASQVFWLALTFIAMYIIAARFVLPQITGVLQSRKERIADDLDKAANLKKEAEQLEKDYQTSLESMHAKANDILNEALGEVTEQANKRRTELDAVLAKEYEKADKNIQETREQAMEVISQMTSDLSREITQKLANIKVSKKQADETAQAVLKDI